jgi:hypothetical protein
MTKVFKTKKIMFLLPLCHQSSKTSVFRHFLGGSRVAANFDLWHKTTKITKTIGGFSWDFEEFFVSL